MFVLFETPAGFAIFKLLNQNKLAKSENLYKDFETAEAASKIVKLLYFYKFEDTTEALAATTALVDSKLSKPLKKALRNGCTEMHEQLAVADAKLGNAIKDKLQLSCISNTSIQELMRCIRCQMDSLITEVSKKEMTAMALGLAHSLSRYKLKFSPDKIDTMVIQGICLLDDLDKELNNYIMRAREWYGWHFPELGKIVQDNFQYIKTMLLVGQRENAINCDMSDILTEDIENKVKEAAETSMGSEITGYDAEHMQYLCVEIIELHQYRAQLCDYLKSRMMALAPNLTILVGDLVGARLISKAGSLTSLAKHPASTLQILGAEKALFRALKSKRNTPKYGLIYHSQLVGQSSVKNKGKASRMLAAKAALATRFDALAEISNLDLGTDHKANLEMKLRQLEEGNIRRVSGTAKAKAKFEKYHQKNDYMQYSTSVDSTLPNKKPLIEEIDTKQNEEMSKKKKKKHSVSDEKEKEEEEKAELNPVPKKKKKHNIKSKTEDTEEASTAQDEMHVKTELDSVPKKKKKHSIEPKTEDPIAESSTAQEEVQVTVGSDVVSNKKKKRSIELKIEATTETSTAQEEDAVLRKKKKQNIESEDMETPDTSFRKRKRHSVELKIQEELSNVPKAQTETDSDLVPKKKKKKKKYESAEIEEAVCADTTEVSTSVKTVSEVSETCAEGQKKKKKKNREKESEEMQEMSVSVEEVEEPVSSEKKKKKKKLKHD